MRADEKFESVLADKQVKEGGDVSLRCEANTADIKAKWEKNGQSLQCVTDKHIKSLKGKTCTLEIKNATMQDEGKYTVTVKNKSGSASCSAMVTVELKEWRTVEWNFKPMITPLQSFRINSDEVTELRFLLHGPIGAGKSSIINTIKSIFEGRQFINCLAAPDLTEKTFTTKPTARHGATHFHDMQEGVHEEDIIKALKGHIPNNYEFHPEFSMSEDSKHYISNPTLNDQIHCLISVIPADKVIIMDDGVIPKMKSIREEASKLGIPQLVFLTRVDQACPMTQKDLTKIYQSKKIKEKMEDCHVKLGVPMNCIFPVKNYHEEVKMNSNLNCLMLEGLTQAVYSAHDYVKKSSLKQKAFPVSRPLRPSRVEWVTEWVEFVSVLVDKQVTEEHDAILWCEANTEGVTAKWEKNDQSFQCVADKHKIKQTGTKFYLEIMNPGKEDEGKYTLTLENKLGSVSCSAMVTVVTHAFLTELKEWRAVEWNLNPMITHLQNLKINNDEVTEFRFLLHGPVGAGKSSIINTIKTVFEGHQFINCLTASELTGHSFTKKYEKFSFGTLPFAIYDVMGLEANDKKGGELAGAHQDDIIKALKGHIPDDYEFKPEASMFEDNENYISNPTLNDKIHCLISVIPADRVTLMDAGVIQKIKKTIRLEASKLDGTVQCQTVPMNSILPVKNYHEEVKMNDNLNCLMLQGLTQAVYSANDYVKNFSLKQKAIIEHGIISGKTCPEPTITRLQTFKTDEATELRFLLHGPVGAGKSSIINTINSIFEGHQFINCLAASELTGHSFTKKFRPEVSISEDNKDYISNPTLNDQIHCLISVVAADKVTLMNDGVIQKMKAIRAEASKLGIPQLVFMTRVDQACKMTQKDVTKIYQSKKIREKMQECSNRLGVPMNCIFPVKNYHEETKINESLNCLMLEGLTQAVHSANDYVKNFSLKQKPVE
ncbi:hypothetical protein NFI96_029498 [Prochilodus magdalenae]|nr:hypothetical protein NFI96_029498 [Prochilodus magdalenae]